MLYIANERYKRLSKKEKESLEKSLKKMGFFVLVIFLLVPCVVSSSDIPDPPMDFPVLIPMNTMSKAETSVENIVYDMFAYPEEETWRKNTELFLSNGSINLLNNNNNSTIF